MANQNTSQQSTKDFEFYFKYNFSLTDLMDLVPSIRTFTIETNEIEVSISENFTFGTDQYIVKMPKSSDNQKRIFYYSLLCYLFEICDEKEASYYIEAFINYVLHSEIILPYKIISNRTHKNITPVMTTNQIKSSFAKFISLLKIKIRKQKMILQEISTLPQIDFVFMSIFQMYMRKNDSSVENCLEKFLNQIGISIKFDQNKFILNQKCEVQRKTSYDEWDLFFIGRSNTQKKPNKFSIQLKRKDTTESVGSIDQFDKPKTEEEINDTLHYKELINARFVESCQTQDVKDLQNNNNGVKQKQGVFFAMMNDKLFVKKEKPQNLINPTPEKVKLSLRPRRTFLLHENMNQSKMLFLDRKKFKNKRMKTQTQAYNLSKSKQFNFAGNYRPWSPKQEKIEYKERILTSNLTNQIRNTINTSNISKISFCQDAVKEFQYPSQENNPFQVKFPQKRHTLQKFTFYYGTITSKRV